MNRRLAGALCSSIVLGFLGRNLGAQQAGLARPPIAPVRAVTDDYFGTKVVDNYRYFENLKDPEVQQWMKAQADYTHAVLERAPRPRRSARTTATARLGATRRASQFLAAAGRPIFLPQATRGGKRHQAVRT